MDYTTFLWFEYIEHHLTAMDRKLDIIADAVKSPDIGKIKELTAHVNEKRAALQKAIDDQKQAAPAVDLGPPKEVKP